MSEKQLVDEAFAEFEQDPEASYVLSNIVGELEDADSIEYFLNKLKPYDEKLFSMNMGSSLVRELIARWALKGGNVTTDHFSEVSEWVATNLSQFDDDLINAECMDMVMFYSPQAMYFSNDETENARFSDHSKIEFWVEKAIEHAQTVDHWVYIIETIAQPYSGSHLADSDWGKRILERGLAVLEKKDATKLKKKAQAYF